MLVSATVIYTHAEAFLRQTRNSLTFFDQVLTRIHSYWVWFDYCKKFCLTTNKPNTSPMFPLRCELRSTTKSFAQWNLIHVHLLHSEMLEKQENKEKLF